MPGAPEGKFAPVGDLLQSNQLTQELTVFLSEGSSVMTKALRIKAHSGARLY